jgi:hypothetical protein
LIPPGETRYRAYGVVATATKTTLFTGQINHYPDSVKPDSVKKIFDISIPSFYTWGYQAVYSKFAAARSGPKEQQCA